MTGEGVTTAQHPPQPWHALSADEVAGVWETGEQGLAEAAVARRRAQYGPNQLAEAPPPSPLVVLARQFRSPLIYILVIAAIVTLLLREYLDAIVIGIVVAINAMIGFWQERKAEQAVRALAQLVVPVARVVRHGREQEVDSRELVPGDVVLLEPGARVPADLRLRAATALEIDESLLTGESAPVRKQLAPLAPETVLADRRCMAYSGSVVTSGRGHGVVVATGQETELGAIAGLIRQTRELATPLQVRMGRFARFIGLAVAAGSALAFATGLALGGDLQQMFLTAVALAVAAIPEGLPIAVTVTLALGVHRMAKRHAIVRRLPAVETLGSTTVIGSDKTGTLTENRMTVQELWAGGESQPAGQPATPGTPLYEALLAGVLTNEAEIYETDRGGHSSGDPTEVALLTAAAAAGIIPDEVRDAYPLFAEIPFEPERRYSASIRERDGGHVTFVKGAPERIAEMCTHQLAPDGTLAPLDRAAVAEAAAALAGRGLRVLAMAGSGPHDRLTDPEQVAEPAGLVLLGLQGMLDPPRPGVAESIATCRGAGIRVVMITGDHAATAAAIAARLGLIDPAAPAAVLTGEELARLDDDQLRARVPEVTVYARVAPEDKLRVVAALQARGEVVAVTGDGVNDAPALKAAAIGVAMGRTGTDVAREASDMVLTDDNFVSIAAAVEEGRTTFDNIRKASFFLVSTGAATIIAILVGLWLGWPLLMLPAQLLWLNLVTNGLQDKALAFEPGEQGLLERPPRPVDEGVIPKPLWGRIALVGVVMAAGTLAMFNWELTRSGSLTSAQTVALTTMVVFMACHVGNARVAHHSAFRVSPLANPFLLVATVAALGVHIAALYAPPTQFLLRVEPIDLAAWLRIVPVALTVVVAVELDKLVRRTVATRRLRKASGG
ncbi:HAD-IC family P-type ATPase [Natronosporangium hydrolyticum]|uniref:HAD-IC family P-type ATPase n=1 Tax=Natronosporangium hydrolyticum TaxID=2811111 RepID=A0A895YJ84_9ACTN|nr:HAD-IC family P-type ATPase [Natronosporangium hydrolyticum]QSB16055.1 HAD-IC family P-type ATPase [Natronosporangium hydrolyticum]